MKRMIFPILFLLVLSGCRTVQPVQPVEVTKTHNEVSWVHDSIYLERFHKILTQGDTVYIHDSIYKSVVVESRDTIHDSIPKIVEVPIIVEKEKELSGNQQFLIRSGIIAWIIIACVILSIIGIVIYKFFK